MIEHESILTDVQKRVLRAVGPFARRAGFYLAGGTAMALRFGHRRSEDFDWFAPALSRPDSLLADLQAEGLSLQETQIEAGTVVIWKNTAGRHTVTADDGSFDSPIMALGEEFKHTFDHAGRVQYFCKLHGAAGGQKMSGTITVK